VDETWEWEGRAVGYIGTGGMNERAGGVQREGRALRQIWNVRDETEDECPWIYRDKCHEQKGGRRATRGEGADRYIGTSGYGRRDGCMHSQQGLTRHQRMGQMNILGWMPRVQGGGASTSTYNWIFRDKWLRVHARDRRQLDETAQVPAGSWVCRGGGG